MPKQCKADNCTFNIFSNLYCKRHQYMRSDSKYLASKAKSMEKKKKAVDRLKTAKKAKPKKKSVVRKKRLIPLPKLDKLCWKFISLAFRLQDSNELGYVQCATCPSEIYYFGTKALHMGHFCSRRRAKTKFLRTNMAGQCNICNGIGNYGRPYEMGVHLNSKHGEGTAEKMLKLSKETFKHDRVSLKRILLDAIYLLEKESNKKNLEDWKSGLLKQELKLYNDALDRRYEDSEIILGSYRIP